MSSPMTSHKTLRLAAMVVACLFATQPHAQLADLSDVPLANSPSDTVLPNLMYILDDSGSMAWDYMPDNILNLSSGTSISNCKAYATAKPSGGAGSMSAFSQVQCANGEPPYYASAFNQVYYNPNITYAAGVDSTGASMGDQNITSAVLDKYLSTSTQNLTNNYEIGRAHV